MNSKRGQTALKSDNNYSEWRNLMFVYCRALIPQRAELLLADGERLGVMMQADICGLQ